MYEINRVRQDDPGLFRRWFTSDNSTMDLYVWENPDTKSIVRFQFYFDRQQDEKMVEWKGTENLWCARVDEGDYKRLYKAAPVLTEGSNMDLCEALTLFRACACEIEDRIRAFVEKCFVDKLPAMY